MKTLVRQPLFHAVSAAVCISSLLFFPCVFAAAVWAAIVYIYTINA